MRSTLPLPRTGWLGIWDRLVGPGMTTAELSLVLSVSLIAAILAGLNVWNLGMGWLLALISTVIAFDVIGGAVCNMTQTTKRWVHRDGTGAKEHLGFIALHVLHIVIIALLFRGDGFDWVYALVVSLCLLVSAVIVVSTPERLKMPTAVLLYLAALLIVLLGLGLTPVMEWFVPALFIKLLMGHAVPLQK